MDEKGEMMGMAANTLSRAFAEVNVFYGDDWDLLFVAGLVLGLSLLEKLLALVALPAAGCPR